MKKPEVPTDKLRMSQVGVHAPVSAYWPLTSCPNSLAIANRSHSCNHKAVGHFTKPAVFTVSRTQPQGLQRAGSQLGWQAQPQLGSSTHQTGRKEACLERKQTEAIHFTAQGSARPSPNLDGQVTDLLAELATVRSVTIRSAIRQPV
jgi:hypothetical protein